METNDDYCPQEPIYYNYEAKHILSKDINSFSNTDDLTGIFICVYKINTNGKFPFLEFLLQKNMSEKLSLISLPMFYSFAYYRNTLLDYSKVFLSGTFYYDNFQEFIKNLKFDGFYVFSKKIYLFYDITECEYKLDDTYLSSNLRFALTDELLNHRNVCNIEIDPETTNFFLKNDLVNYLYDQNNEAYEIPVVGFVGKSTPEKVKFVDIFGESPRNKSEILGPYYYFSNFQNAIRQGGWSNNYKPESVFNRKITDDENGRYIKGGIIRFAIFTGKTKYIENMPNDPNDESEIKKFRLEDPNLDKMNEILTLRISDHDGNWSKSYDSVYLGNIELDDGSLLIDTPILVVKEYNQQVPISSHYIDKTKLGDKFDNNNLTYSII